ncbi:MAG: arabinan endo-1,5-alpha-L-arabinosidase [Bacteroidota bacterium]|nr:arabinan endo-1,5-alpha-L-arabinosidase [Bacteroidota bacterium]
MKYLVFVTGLILSGIFASQQACSQDAIMNSLKTHSDDYTQFSSLSNRSHWGTYNVHDPACIKVGEYFYLYSTDAIYIPEGRIFKDDSVKMGHIQVRRSKDLVNWEFMGWAFEQIPQDAAMHIRTHNNGKGADGIWAPYIIKVGKEFRLYYAVSAFGKNVSYIGLAVSNSPMGPWKLRGPVVKTTSADVMNAIDPTVIRDEASGRTWMIYGSYFGGIYCVELNLKSGLCAKSGDKGTCIAKRKEGDAKIIEAPDVIYNPELKKYYLFVSYDPLFTHYNVRVGRSDKPEGPYYDFFGNDMAEPVDHLPTLTYAYRFENHPGWAGVAHCNEINDRGRYFMFHQGRLAPDNLQLNLHVREMGWLPSGWPVVSPERFAGTGLVKASKESLQGDWEVIFLNDISDSVRLCQGQIPPGGWSYSRKEFNNSMPVHFSSDGTLELNQFINWNLNGDNLIEFKTKAGEKVYAILFSAYDWENKKETIVFSGIAPSGYSFWGKKIK